MKTGSEFKEVGGKVRLPFQSTFKKPTKSFAIIHHMGGANKLVVTDRHTHP